MDSVIMTKAAHRHLFFAEERRPWAPLSDPLLVHAFLSGEAGYRWIESYHGRPVRYIIDPEGRRVDFQIIVRNRQGGGEGNIIMSSLDSPITVIEHPLSLHHDNFAWIADGAPPVCPCWATPLSEVIEQSGEQLLNDHTAAINEMKQSQEVIDIYSRIMRKGLVDYDTLLISKLALVVSIVKQQNGAISISKEHGDRWMIKELREVRNMLIHATTQKVKLLPASGGVHSLMLEKNDGSRPSWDAMHTIRWQATFTRRFFKDVLASKNTNQ